jgi:hypothetical protein
MRIVDGVTTMLRRGGSPRAKAFPSACVAAVIASLTRWSNQPRSPRAHAVHAQRATWMEAA